MKIKIIRYKGASAPFSFLFECKLLSANFTSAINPIFLMKNKIELTAEIKYKLLLNISHKIQGTLDLDKILNLLLDMLANIIDYDAAGIFILSEDINHPGYHQTR